MVALDIGALLGQRQAAHYCSYAFIARLTRVSLTKVMGHIVPSDFRLVSATDHSGYMGHCVLTATRPTYIEKNELDMFQWLSQLFSLFLVLGILLRLCKVVGSVLCLHSAFYRTLLRSISNRAAGTPLVRAR